MWAPRNLLTWGVLVLAMVSAVAGTLHATVGNVPEVDGGSMVIGLGLLTGLVLILRARKRNS